MFQLNTNVVTYFYSNHWIAFLIYLKIARVWVLDSLDRDLKMYKDFIGVLDK